MVFHLDKPAVRERLARATGIEVGDEVQTIGGIIGTFRLGPMPHEVAAASLTLFLEQVAPQFRG